MLRGQIVAFKEQHKIREALITEERQRERERERLHDERREREAPIENRQRTDGIDRREREGSGEERRGEESTQSEGVKRSSLFTRIRPPTPLISEVQSRALFAALDRAACRGRSLTE